MSTTLDAPTRTARLRLWPRSLATRTAVVLLAGLALVQGAGLTIHALDRVELQRWAQLGDVSARMANIYRSVALTPADQREQMIEDMDVRDGAKVRLEGAPPVTDLPPMEPPIQRRLRLGMQLVPMPQPQRPREMMFFGGRAQQRVTVGMRLPEGRWVDVTVPLPPVRIWHSPTFLLAFAIMTATAAGLTLWAVRRLTAPVRTLAAAAQALGRDVNAPPLPEDGPTEVATAAAAFNTMAANIRRFVQDRTFLLTAIGHDLKTPITRMRLRAEFVEDDELRRKFLLDLDELGAMVSATLAFGRDITTDEPVGSVDLPALARTVLDEASDARPEMANQLSFEGPPTLPVRVRPGAIKRALTNLVINAIAYGGNAHLVLSGPSGGKVTLRVEDDGPGIPPDQIERVFEPFHRVETSRNRETGGTGLGLPIARNILRAHGGDVTLSNRAGGGACATVTLPA